MNKSNRELAQHLEIVRERLERDGLSSLKLKQRHQKMRQRLIDFWSTEAPLPFSA